MCNKKVAVGRFTNVCCLAVVIRQVSCTLYGTCWRFSSTVLDGDEQVLDEDDGEASVFVPSASPPSSSRLKEAAVPSHTLIHVTKGQARSGRGSDENRLKRHLMKNRKGYS